MYHRGFWIGKFAYVIRIFQGVNGVSMATKCTGLANSNMLPKFLRDPSQLPWQPNLDKK